MKALVIEDKEEVVEEISVCLKLSWAQADIIATAEGGKGIDLVEAESPDILILGLELPDMDGLKVLKQIRSFSDVPIIVLAAREAEMDKGTPQTGGLSVVIHLSGEVATLILVKHKLIAAGSIFNNKIPDLLEGRDFKHDFTAT